MVFKVWQNRDESTFPWKLEEERRQQPATHWRSERKLYSSVFHFSSLFKGVKKWDLICGLFRDRLSREKRRRSPSTMRMTRNLTWLLRLPWIYFPPFISTPLWPSNGIGGSANGLHLGLGLLFWLAALWAHIYIEARFTRSAEQGPRHS